MNIDIFDFNKRIIDTPYYQEWENKEEGFVDSISENPKLNYKGLNDHQKVALYIYAWSKQDFNVSKGSICKEFSMTRYKVAKIVKELGDNIEVWPSFSERTGLLCGKGYHFNICKYSEKPNKL